MEDEDGGLQKSKQSSFAEIIIGNETKFTDSIELSSQMSLGSKLFETCC